MGRGCEQTSFQEDIQMASTHMKRCSTSLIMKEKAIKTTTRHRLSPVSRLLSKRQQRTSTGENVEKTERLCPGDKLVLLLLLSRQSGNTRGGGKAAANWKEGLTNISTFPPPWSSCHSALCLSVLVYFRFHIYDLAVFAFLCLISFMYYDVLLIPPFYFNWQDL